MTIQFVIRDDDTCFFTKPADLHQSYSAIWSEFPITLAVVPWQKGTLAGHIPVTHWHTNSAFSIGENVELVVMINKAIALGYADVALHGIHHTYTNCRNKFIPELVNYTGDFEKDLLEAKLYLDKLFNLNINIFVPPSNTMDKGVASILIRNEWNLLNLPGLRKNTRSYLSYRHQIARLERLMSFLTKNVDMSKPIVWRSRWEVGGYPLTPNTDINNLHKAFHIAVENGHPFILATHYWEHSSLLPKGNKTQYHLLMDFLDYVSKFNVKPTLARDLIL